MGKKNQEREPSTPRLSEEVLNELVARALGLDPGGEEFSSFLLRLRSIPAGALPQFANALARQGQEKALPILLALACAEDLAPAAVESIGWVRSQEAASLLQAQADASPSREIRKAAGRGLHRRRSLGLHVETAGETAAAQASQVAPAPQPRPTSKTRAWASAVDGHGSRFLFLEMPRPFSGGVLVFMMVNDKSGILEARAGHVHVDEDAQIRVDEVSRQSLLSHTEIPFDYARHLVKEGQQKAQEHGQPLPVDYMVWKESIGQPEGYWEKPPAYQELNAVKVLMEPGLLEESDRLLDLREFRSWFLDTDEMRPYAQEMEQARHGSLVLSQEAQMDRQERVLTRAMEDLLGGEDRALYKRRLEEMSYLLLRTDRERDAKRALAAAVALKQEQSPSRIYLPGSRAANLAIGERSPLAGHPFFKRLVAESLERALGEITRDRKVIVAG